MADKMQKICVLCNENPSKYCCPRCNTLYCSLGCYKSEKHLECSEDFYRDCVKEELAGGQVDKESKQKMIDILTKLHKEDAENSQGLQEMLNDFREDLGSDAEENSELDSDDEDFIELKERVKGLNLDDADEIWNALTEDEKNEFTAFISKGDVGTVIPTWEPWWHFKRRNKLIEEDDSEDKLEAAALEKCPHLKPVSKLTELTSVKPSPAIRFNIINVLASYAFIARYFNGEVDPVEGTLCLLAVCANLDTNANFDDPRVAVESVAQKCIQSELIETDEESLEIMKHDVLLILNGPSKTNKSHYCIAALSHIFYLLFEAKNASKSQNIADNSDNSKREFSKKFQDHKSNDLPQLDVKKVKKCIKKTEYYLSYVASYGIVTEW